MCKDIAFANREEKMVLSKSKGGRVIGGSLVNVHSEGVRKTSRIESSLDLKSDYSVLSLEPSLLSF